MIPGLISDVLAVLILIPPVQNALKATMMKVMMKRQQAMMEKMMGGMMGDMGGMGGARPEPVCRHDAPDAGYAEPARRPRFQHH